MTFGAKLRELREAKGMSQQALAELIDVAQGAIVFWESGKRVPAFDSVQKLCDALGVSCAEFDGCLHEPVKSKRTRGRPKKE